MGEIKFVVGLTMVALFAIAIISYAANFADDNNSEINLGDDSEFSSLNQNLKNNLSKFNLETNTSSKAFFEGTIESGDEVMLSGGQFKVGLGGVWVAIVLILKTVRTNIFGGSAALGIVITALSTILVYIGIRYVYKTWVGKDPD